MPPAASKWDKVKPAGIKTWVRIRPLAAEGEKGHADGEAVEKQLGEFDEKVVNIINHDQKGKVSPYDYMSKVFPVKCTQEDVGQEVLGDGGRLLEDFWNERSVMIFAYGQTGTGKTTTMFGFPESLASEVPDPGWGLLPRAVHATLEHNAQLAKQGVHTVLLLSAVEFYAFMAYDLADKAGKQMCTMKGHQVIGNTYTKCDSPAILKEFIERVYSNRKVVSTKMNDGSSRSHCAMILTLLTLDASTRTFRQTQFSIVDLAGAERPEKALGFRITKEQAVLEMFKYMRNPTEDMTPGLQGYLINFELSNLLTEVVGATNCHKAGRKYTPGWGMSGQGAMSGFRALESPPRVPLGCLPPSASRLPPSECLPGCACWQVVLRRRARGRDAAGRADLPQPVTVQWLGDMVLDHELWQAALRAAHVRQARRGAQDGRRAQGGAEGGQGGRGCPRELGHVSLGDEVRSLQAGCESVHGAAADILEGAERYGRQGRRRWQQRRAGAGRTSYSNGCICGARADAKQSGR